MKTLKSLPRVVFMGTPDIAVPTLQALAAAQPGRWNLVGVVTQPDRPQGRKRTLTASAVKIAAQDLSLPLLQPERFRTEPDAVEALAHWAPDVVVVMAFGQILPRQVLAIPPLGCLNIHCSLLPAHRGASPIATAILCGDETTGSSVMLMDESLDTGPVLARASMPILPVDTNLSLGRKMAGHGAKLILDTLPRWLAGEIRATPQRDLPGTVSTCRIWRKKNGLLDWHKPADYLERLLRASAGWPGAYTFWRGQPLKILAASCDLNLNLELPPGGISLIPAGLAVQTGIGCLLIQRMQLAGRQPLDTAEVLRGAGRELPGSHFTLTASG